MQREVVAVSGPKSRSFEAAIWFNWSRIIPGSTRTHRSSMFHSSTLSMYFDTSIINPSPVVCPAKEVPALRAVILHFFAAACFTKETMSSPDSGNATPLGISSYIDAS